MTMPNFTGLAALGVSASYRVQYGHRQRQSGTGVMPQLPVGDGGGGCHPGIGPCSADGWKTLWHADCTSEQIKCKWVCR
jgi:hypothetical protein